MNAKTTTNESPFSAPHARQEFITRDVIPNAASSRRRSSRRGVCLRQTRGASTWILKMSHNERSTSGCRSSVHAREQAFARARDRARAAALPELGTPFRVKVNDFVTTITIPLCSGSRLRIITAETVTIRRACISCV